MPDWPGTAVLEGTPLYSRIKHALRRKIVAGSYGVGDQIPTEFELAAEYGVSRPTVSRAVSELVREKYVSRQRGKGTFVSSAKPEQTLSINVVSQYVATHPRLDRPAMGESASILSDYNVLQGLIHACRELGCQTRFVDPDGGATLQTPTGERPGIVCMDTGPVARLVSGGAIVVVPYFPVPVGMCSNIVADWEGAFYEATCHLIGQGRRRIAILSTISGTDDAKTRLREKGYARALREDGRCRGSLLVDTRPTLEGIRGAIVHLLGLADRPTALLASNDLRARYAIRVLREQGIEVPRDMSVVGFDDDPEAQLGEPPLTTCHPPHFECGYESVQLLKRLMRGEVEGPKEIVIPCKLVVRESSGPAPESGGA